MKDLMGYGFRPTDEELVGYYLYNKIKGKKTRLVDGYISEVNICSEDPWNLRFKSKYKSGDLVWYFFSRRDNYYGNGNRQNRKTCSGKWKLTGKAVDVKDQLGTWCRTPGKKIGHKRVLVFLDGINSEKPKSDWIIHEFHCELLPEDERTYVICRLEYKGSDINIAKATDPTPTFVPEATNTASPSFVPNMTMLGGNYNMHQSVEGGYSESFNLLPVSDSANHGQWSSDDLVNPQQSVPYSYVDELGPIIEDNRYWEEYVASVLARNRTVPDLHETELYRT